MRLIATWAAAIGLVLNLTACGASPGASQGPSARDVAPSVDSPNDAEAERLDAALASEQNAHPPKDPGGQAVWWPADAEAVGPDTRMLDVMVLELECASGKTAEGRIKPPTIEWSNDSATVTFRVSPIEVAEGEGVDCQGNPPTPHRLDLGERLGDRRLLDGGTHPPRQPTPWNP